MDWKVTLAEIIAERRQELGERPSVDELIALRAGDLSEDERERLLERASWDPEVARELLDLLRFPDLPDDEAASEGETGLDRRWQDMRSRLLSEGFLPGPRAAALPRLRRTRARAWLPVAASFAAGVALAFVIEALLFGVGTGSRREAVKVNLPIVELLALSDTATDVRRGGELTVVPASTEGIVLTLAAPGLAPDSGRPYDLEIRRGRQEVFRSKNLVPGEGGVFVLLLPRDRLAEGAARAPPQGWQRQAGCELPAGGGSRAMTARGWPLLAGCLAAAVAGCGSPAHTPRLPEASETVSVASGEVARSTPGLQRARTQRRLGLDLRRRGRLEEARKALEEARDLFSEHGSAEEQARILSDLGEVLFQLGDFEGLEQAEWQALELAESAHLPSAAATAWNNLGVGFAARGLPSAALNAQGQCLELRRGLGDLSGEAAALHNRGVQLLQLGRVREGIEELRQAVSLHRSFGATAELGQSLASLAWGLTLDGQPDAALTAYDEALSVLTETQADYDLAVAFEQRAQLYRRLGRLREAREDLDHSLVLAEKNGGVSRFHTAYLHLGLGAVLRDQGQIAKALPLLRQSVEEFEVLRGQEGRVMARFELARALRAGGARAEAIAVLEAALTTVESARANLHLASLRGTYLGGWQDVYRELVDLMAEAALEAPNRRDHQLWAARAFAISERARARALLDLLVGPLPSEGLPAQASEARRELLRRQVEQLEVDSLGMDGGSGRGDPSFHQVRLRLGSHDSVSEPSRQRRATLRRLRFELELLQESAANAAGPQPLVAQPVSLAAILRQLEGGTTLLAYSLGAERSWLWRIDSQGVDVRPLAAGPQIEAAARNAHRLFPLSERIGFRKAARSARQHLSDLVLGPLVRTRLEARIAIIPDSALHLIPFAALYLPPGKDGAVRALGEDHEVVHLPSASALVELRLRRDSRRPALRPLAIVADPVFEANDPRFDTGPKAHGEPVGDPGIALARTRQALGGRFGRLLGSAEEARRIAAIAGHVPGQPAVPVVSGFDATRELVTGGSLDGFHLLHFASHALVDADDQALTGLLLSLYRADGRRRDGLLRSRDLYGLRLSADLVVLSACQTALGQEVRGEGVVGLADGFFAAGASQLVVSLWEVDDRATAELMSRFYTHLLLHDRPAADALSRAQRELRDETEWTSPAYWAAFVALGDWQAGADLHRHAQGRKIGRAPVPSSLSAGRANLVQRQLARLPRKTGSPR